MVEWTRTSDGALIARKVVDYTGTGDYACFSWDCSAFYSPDGGRAGLFFS